jgi:single-stranded-DNA-specific exonuclease
VALGTVADLVPLIEDNRILVHHGLKQLANTIHVGLQELMRVARVRRTPDPSTIGFILGPRLNASGRLAAASTGWQLLATRDPREARQLARALDQLNRDRQRIEQEAYELAKKDVERMVLDQEWHCLVVAGQGWHQGVVGIVASRLQRDHYLPTLVITTDEDGVGKGSARSIPGLSVMDGLRACQEELLAFGGHSMAAGLEIEAERIDVFREKLNRWFAGHTSQDQYQERLVADMKLPPEALTRELAKQLSRMEPFGQGNPAPIFVVDGVRFKSKPRVFAQRHLKFTSCIGDLPFETVAFGQALGPRPEGEFSMAGHWEIDSYTSNPVFRMLDWNW